MGKELQKNTKLTVQVLKEENSLAVRGLKELQLVNTPRLKYLAGLYDECIDLCVEMVELTKEDYWYWNLSLQKKGRFFAIKKEIQDSKDKKYKEKGWAYPVLLSHIGIKECMDLFEQRSKDKLVCNVDYCFYAICLERKWEIKKAIEFFIKWSEQKIESEYFQEFCFQELWKLFYEQEEYEKAKNYYLKYFEIKWSFKWIFAEINLRKLSNCFYFLGDIKMAIHYLDFIEFPDIEIIMRKAELLEWKWELKESLAQYKIALEKDIKNKELKEKIHSLLEQINANRKK